MASTVIHRLADRGLIDYDVPVAEYWPEFGANGKSEITVRDVMRHRAGLSSARSAGNVNFLTTITWRSGLPQRRSAGISVSPLYHALTYGWLLSGLARSVTGMECGI